LVYRNTLSREHSSGARKIVGAFGHLVQREDRFSRVFIEQRLKNAKEKSRLRKDPQPGFIELERRDVFGD